MKELASLGPWFLREGRDLSVLASQIDELLGGSQLVVTRVDTILLEYDLPKSQWVRASGPVSLSYHDMYIPVAGGISIPLRPVKFEGKDYAALIDLLGDHLQVSVPYLFHWAPKRVDYKTYSVTRVRSIS